MTVFHDWPQEAGKLWGREPLCLYHGLHKSPLFSRSALIDLMETYPREHYSIIHMAAQNSDERFWREGDAGGLRGAELLEAIESGRLWLNLRCTDLVAPEYRRLLDGMFDEIAAHTGSDDFPSRSLGILISSPKAQVYYHCDLPNQSLWQISGRKTVWVYPVAEPFVRGEDLEKIAVFELEVDIEYQDWFDQQAVRFELEPGQMLHWPLNAPHRVTNHDCLNISVTTEYWADDARRGQRINLANGTLRHGLGLKPRSRATRGLGFAAKSVVNSVAIRSGWLDRVRRTNRQIEFSVGKPE